MNYEANVRRGVLRLLHAGMTQKAIHPQMGVSKAWFNEWVGGKRKGSMKLQTMERFIRYIRDLRTVLDLIENECLPKTGLPSVVGGENVTPADQPQARVVESTLASLVTDHPAPASARARKPRHASTRRSKRA
jgi:hypothetical protein